VCIIKSYVWLNVYAYKIKYMKLKKKYVAIIIALVLIIACRHEIPGVNNNGSGSGTIPPAVTPCSPDSVYFVNQVMPLISSNCTTSGCHDNISQADGVNLTTYAKIMQYVVTGNAANSKLYKVIIKTGSDRMPPTPMPAFTTAQKTIIQKWINQGAKNNNCIANCDTSVFTYSGAIKPMMDNKCVGCHNPASLGGGIDVSTYAAVRVIALNGKLYGSVAHASGYSAMPKNAAKLSVCEIRQVEKWITAGSLNN
jgi:hypothetical protein